MRILLLFVLSLLLLLQCCLAIDSAFEAYKTLNTYTRGQKYMFQVHMQAFSKNGTMAYKKAIFYPTIDQFTRVIVKDSFDWARTTYDANVTVWIELPGGKFSGYIVQGETNDQPYKFPYMMEAKYVAPFFEFLIVTNCLSEQQQNATGLECGEIVVASITREGCPQCAERKDFCDAAYGYCMKPVANYLNQNTTLIPNLTFYLGWKGIDATHTTMQSARSLPSTFQQYSITPVADALGRISEDIGSLFNTNQQSPMNLGQ